MIYLFQTLNDGPADALGTTFLLRSNFPRAEELLAEIGSALWSSRARVLAVFAEGCLRGGTEPVDLETWIAPDELSLLKARSFSPVVGQFERHVRENRR